MPPRVHATAPIREVEVIDLGLTAYPAALELQRRLQLDRQAGTRGDTLLLTEHQPVLTLGRAREEPDLRVAPEVLDRAGIEIVPTERGGDITYHGPGQLVAYAILDLKALDIRVVDHVTRLEETVIRTLAAFGVQGGRRPAARGVWVDGRKIASVGVNVRRWVSMHGIALNVEPDMAHFDLINPCGLEGVVMTSLARETGHGFAAADVVSNFLNAFADVYSVSLRASPALDGSFASA